MGDIATLRLHASISESEMRGYEKKELFLFSVIARI